MQRCVPGKDSLGRFASGSVTGVRRGLGREPEGGLRFVPPVVTFRGCLYWFYAE